MLHTPSGGAGAGATTGGNGRPMSIGAVLEVLREEFPEVTISKIRFLESEGLVEPERSPSGYRKFRDGDVERLAYVLRMQRDHYLPLKVIREHLDALARGEELPLPPAPHPGGLPEPRGAADGPPGAGSPVRLGRAELVAVAGVTEDQFAEWESYGLIGPHEDGGYDMGAVSVARLLADLGRFGLEARHLRTVKAAADREAGLVEQVVAPLRQHRDPGTRERAETTARELAGLSLRLHAALVRTALRLPAP
ncbi:MerR family transcriptional regulator [Streptomyces armeniacus]|uniref:MerR family transcriptional regulator n=1 Tax=Streptomyces armeniacus TaxID=83291 RepID=A0A345XS19_9ACTN|nr:MerR family transcriptional regulator [Streptomyces armeniacus]AXK34435.1 MerR family transcriptional regulator [Streptomyces armeniacus]